DLAPVEDVLVEVGTGKAVEGGRGGLADEGEQAEVAVAAEIDRVRSRGPRNGIGSARARSGRADGLRGGGAATQRGNGAIPGRGPGQARGCFGPQDADLVITVTVVGRGAAIRDGDVDDGGGATQDRLVRGHAVGGLPPPDVRAFPSGGDAEV